MSENRYAWVAPYIGLPWEMGAAGPDAFDCWSFFRLVQDIGFGRTIPHIPLAIVGDGYQADGLQRAAHTMFDSGWRSVGPSDKLRDGDAVVVRNPLHVGTWLHYKGGCVLHCVQGIGVVLTQDRQWATSGFGPRRTYRYG